MKQPCVSFDIPNNMLAKNICKPVLENDTKRIILTDNEDSVSLLKNIIQYQNKENAFFNTNCGGWRFGMWGLYPSEVLHQFYKGVISYCLDEFVEMLSEMSRVSFSDGVHKVINSAKK